ncbi:MAG: SNF2-related protein [Thermoanaerobaculia bacterium]|nr:SNF2-related protein [Thermoanaerobaculia bacterium]
MSRHPSHRPRFRVNDRLVHRFNQLLGPGRVLSLHGRQITVFFPRTEETLTFIADDHALKPLELGAHLKVSIEATGEESVIQGRVEDGPEGVDLFRLVDGRVFADQELWPLELPQDPVERLTSLEIDTAGWWKNRVETLELSRLREARGLGSFLGGRIAIHPHQLHVAEQATATDPVRWLLADEVGLGKTVEACLILSRLLRTGRAHKALVVAPSTLTVQWLGELYRKFHQTFVWLDARRRADVAKDFGASFNPFDAHAHAVIALEDLVHEPALAEQASAARLDLLVIDEAHRLERGRNDDGNEAYRAVAPLTRTARHVLLLTATPLEADVSGFFGLLSLLRPDAYPSELEFVAALEEGRPLPASTSATRRVDIGGLPPRLPCRVDLPREPVSLNLTGHPRSDGQDPRVEWLVARAAAFARGGEEEGKSLIFCHDRELLASLKEVLESATRKRVAIFHEDLSPDRRDIECAEFRRSDGPQYMISTECGGEGRNFEFCRRLVMFDLPRDPAAVEQRIGRLDRINRTRPVEIVYFCPPAGFEAELVRLYEALGLFREPLGGLERSLSHVERAIDKAERLWRLRGEWSLPVEELATEVRSGVALRQRAAYHHLISGRYTADMAAGILSRIPRDLDSRMKKAVLGSCQLLGFETAERPGRDSWYIELGGEAIVDHLPGVPGGSRWLGTFVREEAVEREELEFFSSGHPLVEGIFQELEDSVRGRASMLCLHDAGVESAGLVFVYRFHGETGLALFDLTGRERPDLLDLIKRRFSELRNLPVADWFSSLKGKSAEPRYWPALCRAVAEKAEIPGQMEAVAGIRFFRRK